MTARRNTIHLDPASHAKGGYSVKFGLLSDDLQCSNNLPLFDFFYVTSTPTCVHHAQHLTADLTYPLVCTRSNARTILHGNDLC
jgi:hypothetical protein